MAYVSEKIKEEDREYFDSIGFTNISKKPSVASWWAIDREKNIILICRGGIPGEIFWGYQLYLDGELIDMIVLRKTEGDRFDYDLKIHWIVNKIEVPRELIQKGYDCGKITKNIEEAFYGLGGEEVVFPQLVGVTVKINAEIEIRGGM